MNTNITLAQKTTLIHERKIQMDKLWNSYTIELIKKITATERLYHHEVVPYQSGRLKIRLFGKITLEIIRLDDFGPIRMEYKVSAENIAEIILAPSTIDCQGMLDRVISPGNREQIFEHYLGKIEVIYNHIMSLSLRGAQE